MEKGVILILLIFSVFVFNSSLINAESCGDGVCDGNETKAICPSDCKYFRLGIFEPIAMNNLSSTYNWSIHAQVSNMTLLHPKIFRMMFRMDNITEPDIGGCLIGPKEFNYTGCARFNLTVYLVQKQNITVIGMDESFPMWMTGAPRQEREIPYPRNLTSGSTYMQFLQNYSDAWYTLASNFTNINYWEPGNEYNLNSTLKGYNLSDPDKNPVNFTFDEKVNITLDLMYRAHHAIRQANPNAFIFMPGLAAANKGGKEETDGSSNILLYGIRDFINQTYINIESGQFPNNTNPSTNPRDYFDGIAYHPYARWKGPSVNWDDGNNWTNANKQIYDVIQQHEAQDIPVLFSEYGFTDSLVPNNWNSYANWTFESINLSLNNFPWLWGITWHRLFDIPRVYYVPPPNDYYPGGLGYGLLYNNSGANNGLPTIWKPIAFTIESFTNNYPIPTYSIYNYEFNNLGSFDGFTFANISDNRSVGGLIYGKSTTFNPIIFSPLVSIDADKVSQVQIHGSNSCAWYPYEGTFSFFQDNNWIDYPYDIIPDNKPHTYTVDLFQIQNWIGTIQNFSISPTNYQNCNFSIDSIRFISLSVFTIKNPSGQDVAWFGRNGDLVLRGGCEDRFPCTPPTNSFIIANSSDNALSYIDSSGNFCIERQNCAYLDQKSSCNPARDAFIIQNKTRANISYIDFNGKVCLTGSLHSNKNP